MVKSNSSPKASMLTDKAESRILCAARNEFSRNGFPGARMQAIAKNAGVNKALLHYYFRNKEKLYQAVLSEILSKVIFSLQKTLETMPEQNDIRYLIHAIVQVYTTTFRENPHFVPMMMRELIEGGKRIPDVAEGLFSLSGHVPSKIFSLLAEGMKCGTIRKMSPIHVLLSILSMAMGSFLLFPIARVVNRKATGNDLALDEAYCKQRISAISEMACEGLFLKP